MRPEIWIIGCGMGTQETLTCEAQKAILECDCLIGAPRLLPAERTSGQIACVRNEEIVHAINSHPEYQRIGVLVSGDPGFFSAAKELNERLADYEVRTVCGVSSLSYFCSRLKLSWEDAKMLSVHGRKADVAKVVAANKKTFLLTGGDQGVDWVLNRLCENGLGETEVYIGQNLGYPNEQILHGLAMELTGRIFEPLSVIFAINRCAGNPVSAGIPDLEFLRGDVPMTKFEVRCISLAKLGISRGDTVYDVGAGTGAVSIEMARLSLPGRVYAIEKNREAVSLLNKNKEKFKSCNLTVVETEAPNGLDVLPGPDCVFIGGSSGRMREIFDLVLKKNPTASIVVNAVTLETLAAAQECFLKHGIEPEITQISASHAKKAGAYHMMTGANPVFILNGRGLENDK